MTKHSPSLIPDTGQWNTKQAEHEVEDETKDQIKRERKMRRTRDRDETEGEMEGEMEDEIEDEMEARLTTAMETKQRNREESETHEKNPGGAFLPSSLLGLGTSPNRPPPLPAGGRTGVLVNLTADVCELLLFVERSELRGARSAGAVDVKVEGERLSFMFAKPTGAGAGVVGVAPAAAAGAGEEGQAPGAVGVAGAGAAVEGAAVEVASAAVGAGVAADADVEAGAPRALLDNDALRGTEPGIGTASSMTGPRATDACATSDAVVFGLDLDLASLFSVLTSGFPLLAAADVDAGVARAMYVTGAVLPPFFASAEASALRLLASCAAAARIASVGSSDAVGAAAAAESAGSASVSGDTDLDWGDPCAIAEGRARALFGVDTEARAPALPRRGDAAAKGELSRCWGVGGKGEPSRDRSSDPSLLPTRRALTRRARSSTTCCRSRIATSTLRTERWMRSSAGWGDRPAGDEGEAGELPRMLARRLRLAIPASSSSRREAVMLTTLRRRVWPAACDGESSLICMARAKDGSLRALRNFSACPVFMSPGVSACTAHCHVRRE